MADAAARTRTKIAWRILPLIMFIAILNYLDRANIAFAALQMNKDLGFTASVYGFGAGIFFIGYCLFEIQQFDHEPSRCAHMVIAYHGYLGDHSNSHGMDNR